MKLHVKQLPACFCLGAMLTAAITACDAFDETLEPCAKGVDLAFVYDYNIQRADMFNDHVGSVTVYVFDADGNYITQREEFNTSADLPLRRHDYRMRFDLEPGSYRFIALAHQKSQSECLAAPGAKYRRSQLSRATSRQEDLSVTLDRENSKVIHANVALDTLWHGMSAAPVKVERNRVTTHSISLMRDTKDLTVSLHQLDDPAAIDKDDFVITLTAANGIVGYDNNLLPDETLTYTPYATWITEFRSDGTSTGSDASGAHTDVLERTVHAGLSFNRIMHASSEPAMLTIYNRKTSQTVARINLADCLAQGRSAFEFYNYSPQEFLDREHKYKLDFFLRGDTWDYVDLSISVLSWSKRIQRVSL